VTSTAATINDYDGGFTLQSDAHIPQVTGVMTFTSPADNRCLGFEISFWDGTHRQHYYHAKADIEETNNVTSSVFDFHKGEYISSYRVSEDSVDNTASVAFELTLNDGSKITCGNVGASN
jgi:hypothetical protein